MYSHYHHPRVRRNNNSLVAARTRRECQNDRSGSDRPGKLSDAIQHKPHGADYSSDEQCQADVRIEQSTSDAVKQPRRHQKTESKTDGSYEDIERIRGGLVYASSGRRCLHSSEGECEEEEGADELEKGTIEIMLDVCKERTSTKWHVC